MTVAVAFAVLAGVVIVPEDYAGGLQRRHCEVAHIDRCGIATRPMIAE
jgi:hypothetical protein